MIRSTLIALLLVAGPALAQEPPADPGAGAIIIPGNDPSLDFLFPREPGTPLDPALQGGVQAAQQIAPEAAPREAVESAPGAILRGLDKVSGEVTDIEIATGETKPFGRLLVTLSDCRYPVDDPSSNAYVHLSITEAVQNAAIFDGWMIASSPALSALDHPRYDVWAIRCKSDAAEGAAPSAP